MFGKHRKKTTTPYDKATELPVIRASICTGEKVAGFRHIASGAFSEVMCLKTDADLQEFLRMYEIDEADIKREW